MGLEPWHGLRLWSRSWSEFDVFEFGLPHEFIRTTVHPLAFNWLRGFAHDVLAGIDVRLADSSALELLECLLSPSALVNGHAFDLATLTSLLA